MKTFKSTGKENQTSVAAVVTGFLLSNFTSKQSKALPTAIIITSFINVFKVIITQLCCYVEFFIFSQVVSVKVFTAALKPQ